MSNPARELHGILSKWRDGHKSGAATVGSVRGSGYLTPTREAARLIDQIEAVIDGWERSGKDVAIHRRRLQEWAAMVFAAPHGWQSNVAGENAYPQFSLDALSMFADMLDFASEGTVSSVVADRIREYVLTVKTTLAEDGSLSDDFRAYMQHLIDAVENAMEHRDAVALREELQHLWIAVFAAEEQSKETGKWKEAFARFSRDFMIQTLASIISTAVTGTLPIAPPSAPAVEN